MSRKNQAVVNWLVNIAKGAGKGAAAEIAGSKEVQKEMDNKFLAFLSKYKWWFIGGGLLLISAIVVSVWSAVSSGNKLRRFNR